MKVKQVWEILNSTCLDILGKPQYIGPRTAEEYIYYSEPQEGYSQDPSWIVAQDLRNVVDIGKKLLDSGDKELLLNTLINHIGRVIFVNRTYNPIIPSIMKDGWSYGSIMEKIDMDLPKTVANPTWYPQDGVRYDQDTYNAPKNVRAKLFNLAVAYEIEISKTVEQLEQSFSSAQQLNGFLSMIEVKIRNRMAVDYANLTRLTINNFICASVYKDFNTEYDTNTKQYNFGTKSGVKAVNLLGLYKEKIDPDTTLTPETCIKDTEFLKFAAYNFMLYSDRMADMSTLFNIGGKQRFTPKDLQHIVMLSEFEKGANIYLQSTTFHNELTRLPKAETINYWQGTGEDYSFSDTSRVHYMSKVTADGENVEEKETIITGVLGVIFDDEALGILNERNKVTTHYNASGDFFQNYYKSFARYFNDYDENFIVFFVA